MKKILWGIAMLVFLSACADNGSSQKEGNAKVISTDKTDATVKKGIPLKSITGTTAPTATATPVANKAATAVDFKQLEQISNEAHKGIENLQKQKQAVEKTVDELLKEFE